MARGFGRISVGPNLLAVAEVCRSAALVFSWCRYSIPAPLSAAKTADQPWWPVSREVHGGQTHLAQDRSPMAAAMKVLSALRLANSSNCPTTNPLPFLRGQEK